MNRVKVGFYGTSNRMKDRILPICAQLQDELEMVCIGGRSEEKARPLGERYGMPWYTDLDAMLDRHAVDMVCNIVNCSANYETAARIAAHGVSCIIETPIELDLKKAHALFDLVRSHGVRIEVAENTFRQPDYRIAKKLLDTTPATTPALTLWVMATTTLVLAPFSALAVVRGGEGVGSIGAVGWAGALYTGIGCSTVAYLLYTRGLRGVTATVSAILLLVQVFVAAVLAYALQGVGLGPVALLGAIITLAAMILVSLAGGKERGARAE